MTVTVVTPGCMCQLQEELDSMRARAEAAEARAATAEAQLHALQQVHTSCICRHMLM